MSTDKNSIISQFYDFLGHAKYGLIAVNVLGKTKYKYYPKTKAEYLEYIDKCGDKGQVYQSLNPVNPAIDKNKWHTDSDIVAVLNIFLDIDAIKSDPDIPEKELKKYAATEQEYQESWKAIPIIKEWLSKHGFKTGYYDKTGNGIRFILPIPAIELNKDNREKVSLQIKALLDIIRKDTGLYIDAVHDLCRITGIPTTLNKKLETANRKNRIREPMLPIPERDEDEKLRDFILSLNLGTDEKETLKANEQPLNKRLNHWLSSDQKLKTLYDGKISGYKSKSEAELGLYQKLIFYKFNDSEIDTILSDAKIGKWATENQSYKDHTKEAAHRFQKEQISENKTNDRVRSISKSTMTLSGTLYEQVSTKDGYKFAYLKNGVIEYVDEINQDGIKYTPCTDEEVIKRAVLFCSISEDYGSIQNLIKMIESFILKWLDVPYIDRKFYCYYILQTWVYEKFHTIGYARALGDTGTGKTRFLDVIGGLCYKPIFTNGAIGAAPIFRIMDKHHGTLIIDEANFGKSDETQAIMTILNSGWEQGKPVMRCDKEHPEKINIFNPFGPKVLGTRKRFTDSALEARCYTATLTQTDREDILANLDDSFFTEREEITNRLLDFRLRNIDKVKPDPSMQKLFTGIEPRVIQKALPLASMVKDDKAALEEFVKYVKDSQADLIDDRQASQEGMIVIAILELYEEKLGNNETLDSIVISSDDIAEKLNEDLPDGKKTNSKKIGKMLKVLGFNRKAKTIVSSDPADNKERKTKRALETDNKLIVKLLKRYTFLDDEKYTLLRKAVSSVSSYIPSTDFNNNSKLVNNPVTQTTLSCDPALIPLRHETLETHETEKIEKFGKEWEQLKCQPIDSSNLIEFLQLYCKHAGNGTQPGQIREIAEKIFKITPEQHTKPHAYQSYLCKTGDHKNCGGFGCDCECHIKQTESCNGIA
ncbi:MAG TPA: hypothetical protein VN368_00210 [Candidatus Methylomirabilis sp.]|nr:hypothetical protein [Candidatus Methylomirabilis sp.]